MAQQERITTGRETLSEGSGSPVTEELNTQRNTFARRLDSASNTTDVTELAVRLGLDTVRDRFEETADADDRLEFHNVNHSEGVIRRGLTILNALKEAGEDGVTDRTLRNYSVAAAFHDSVQNYDIKPNFMGNIARVRHIGENEAASADEAIARTEEINVAKGETVFTPEDQAEIREAIMATVPGFDPEAGTVVQPNLDKDGVTSSVTARALALADIGTAGMESTERFLREGDAVFREEQTDIAYAVYRSTDIASGELIDLASDEQRSEGYRQRMIGWSKSQVGFATGRKALLEKEIAALSPEGQEAVRGVFTQFDQTIKALTIHAARRENMTFAELAKDMGYLR